jgi:hypothetical protein
MCCYLTTIYDSYVIVRKGRYVNLLSYPWTADTLKTTEHRAQKTAHQNIIVLETDKVVQKYI